MEQVNLHLIGHNITETSNNQYPSTTLPPKAAKLLGVDTGNKSTKNIAGSATPANKISRPDPAADIQSDSSVTKASPLTEVTKQGSTVPTHTLTTTDPSHKRTAATPPGRTGPHPADHTASVPAASKAAKLLGLASPAPPHGRAPRRAHSPRASPIPTAADPFPALARHRLGGPSLRRPDAEAQARARIHDAVQGRLREAYAARRAGASAADVARREVARGADVDVAGALARPGAVGRGAVESAVVLAFLRRVEGAGL